MYINETVGAGQQMLDGRSQFQYFVKVNGNTAGPFTSREMAQGYVFSLPDAQRGSAVITEQANSAGGSLLLG